MYFDLSNALFLSCLLQLRGQFSSCLFRSIDIKVLPSLRVTYMRHNIKSTLCILTKVVLLSLSELVSRDFPEYAPIDIEFSKKVGNVKISISETTIVRHTQEILCVATQVNMYTVRKVYSIDLDLSKRQNVSFARYFIRIW